MKTISTTVIFIFSVLFLFPSLSEARGPAVEPVQGISIDDYKEVPPSQAKGYQFTNGKPKVLTRKVTYKPSFTKVNNKTERQVYGPDASWPTSIILFLLVVMPFGLWFSIMKSLDSKEVETFENTIPFPTINNKSSDDNDDDFNLPKAS